MGKPETKIQSQNDEFARIFDEYRARIEEISRRVVTSPPPGRFPLIPDDDKAEREEAASQRPPAGQAAASGEPVPLAEIEAEQIILAAKRRAEQIIAEAEEKSRKEASKRTQSQVEKILSKARKDAEEIVARARQTTERESSEIITQAKQEAEQLIREITEKARQETRLQSSRAIEEARTRANRMMDEIINSCREMSQMVNEIVGRTRQTIDEFEVKLKGDVAELAKAIAETQRRLEQLNAAALKEREELRPAPVPRGEKDGGLTEIPRLALRVLGARSNGQHGTQPLFSGQVEMRSVSTPFDYQYLKSLKKYLIHIPNIKYLQEYASEEEISILFEITEPLPLLDIIRNIPLVEKVTDDGETISITFKNSI